MYNPQRFKNENRDEAFDLMERYPFATLVTVGEGRPFISHLPLVPKKFAGGVELMGHLSRANPHWKLFVGAETTAVFHGPQAYITPAWYAKKDVPTWNYLTVHAIGKVELVESYDGIVECLKELSAHAERHWQSGWEFFVPEDLSGGALARSIVGFKLKVSELNFKRKLGQGQSEVDRAGVLRGLRTRSDDNSRAVLAEMLALYSSNKKD